MRAVASAMSVSTFGGGPTGMAGGGDGRFHRRPWHRRAGEGLRRLGLRGSQDLRFGWRLYRRRLDRHRFPRSTATGSAASTGGPEAIRRANDRLGHGRWFKVRR